MDSEQIDLGEDIQFDLLYAASYEYGKGPLDYLHRVRTLHVMQEPNGRAREEQYWSNLETYRNTFAQAVGTSYDLIVDVPSRSGYHRPYLSAVRAAMPTVRCVHFVKDTHVNSTKGNLEELRNGCRFLQDNDKDIDQHEHILIVDDVYSEGNIARIVIEQLEEVGLPSAATITVACLLRVYHDEPTEAYMKMLRDGGDSPPP